MWPLVPESDRQQRAASGTRLGGLWFSVASELAPQTRHIFLLD